MKKLIRITTISESLNTLLKGQLRFLNEYYEVVGVADGADVLSTVAAREGIRTVNIPIKREISLLSDLCSLALLIMLLRKEKPEIVHVNTPKGSLLGMIAAWVCRVPIRIYTVTGLRFETTNGSFRKLLIAMERITCACATNVIPEGDGVMNTLIRENITSKPLRKILNGNINGIDIDHFDSSIISEENRNDLRNQLEIAKDDFLFVFVGRLVKDKGINELVGAFNRLCVSKFPISNSIKLLLVGPLEQELDPLLPNTITLIRNSPNIISVGYQNDVRPYFAISNCLAFPSYREGFPNVVLQAGSMGLPSIVTDINGSNEIVIDGMNGVIIPSQNVDALFNAMKVYLDNPLKVKEAARMSRALITSRYEQSKVWQALLEEYKSIESKT